MSHSHPASRFAPVSAVDTATFALFVAAALMLLPVSARAADSPPMSKTMPMSMNTVTSAVAVLYPTEGNTVQGVIRFAKTPEGVRVTGLVSGLKPGKHGFHVHEYGDITAKDGTSAGGHFNPSHKAHGAPDASVRHVGDLGNITADADGNATLNFVDATIALDGPDSILGRGVVVHAGADDLTTQPTGNAGARVAVGVIGIAKGS